MQNYIKHHGIKGQRWGIRRYQNDDGSLTKAGEQRYNKETENDKHSSDSSEHKVNEGKKYLTRKEKIITAVGLTALVGFYAAGIAFMAKDDTFDRAFSSGGLGGIKGMPSFKV